MSDINDIKNYSAEDIRRYWNNQMSTAEMHALEKAAMDDPFLADALEGYSKLKTEPSEDIALLQKRLTARSSGAVVVPMKRNYWWRVAALILLIGGLGTLAFFLNQNDSPVLSKNEKQNQQAAIVDTTPNVQDSSSQQAPPPIGSVSVDKEQSNQYKPSPKALKKDVAPGSKSEIFSNSDGVATAQEVAANKDDDFRKSNAPAAASGALQSLSKKDTTSDRQYKQQQIAERDVTPQGNYLNFFSGKVVDGQNRSIPFATVKMANANQIAAADQYGYFQFKSRDSIAEISISSAGYRERNLVLNSNQQAFNIMLDPLNEKGKLSEVKAKSTGKKAAYDFNDSELKGYVMDAEPVIGWDQYNLYLDSNKRIPTNEPHINGEVVVSFKVNQKGELSSFDVEKSMSKAYNNEAIRLIKQGPAWRVIKGKKPKVKVIVKF